jgi:serine/threonine protein kinase
MSEPQITNPKYAEHIKEIEDFITTTIIPSGVPILEDKDIPVSGKQLPSGANGTGYISSDEKYAIKNIDYGEMIKKDSFVSVNGIKESLNNEIINYHTISDKCPKYFCKFFGYKYNSETHILTIKMENCGEDLFDFYTSGRKPYPESWTVVNHIYQLLKILECLHKNGFVHFDLKLENIVIDKNGILKLIDAGSLTNTNDSKFPKVLVRGTSNHMAPELKTILAKENGPYIIDNDIRLKATDIYSLGIILISMVFNPNIGLNHIYEDDNNEDDTKNKKIKYNNVFLSWQNTYNYSYKAIVTIINNRFKYFFGNDIKFEHFFSNKIIERLTIQELLSMFNEKREADKIEYEKHKAHIQKMEDERKKLESGPLKRYNNPPNGVLNLSYINKTNDSRPTKKSRSEGGNKSKKPRRKRNNKSKRHQQKSHSN